MGNWAFNWVQILAHNKKPIAWRLVLVLAVISYGLLDFGWSALGDLAAPLLIASLGMTLLLAWMADSVKTALLQLFLSAIALLTTFGLMGWLDIAIEQTGILAILVVVIMITSNLVHVLNTLLREMARGLFQFDAVAEALKMNFQPVFLSNLTTALGFLFAGWLNPELMAMGQIVALGAAVSLLLSVSLMPMLLLSFLLEFRVGNTTDRHGFRNLINWLETKLHWRSSLLAISALLSAGLLWASYQNLFNTQMILMLLVFAALFVFYWKSVRLMIFALWLALIAWLLSFQLEQWFVFDAFQKLAGHTAADIDMGQMAPLVLMVSLGLIIDDVVHFFSRYYYAQQGVFRDSLSAVKFAMASVARPIWVTSWLLATTMLVLMFNPDAFIASAAILTFVSIVVVTCMVLVWLPLALTKRVENTKD